MKLFICSFIHLEAEDCQYQGRIKEKANILSKKIPDDNKGFNANDGWLHRWKTFYSIHQLNDEKLSAVEVEATLYCDELADTISDNGYCIDQVFYVDETSLNYKMLPTMTLAAKADRRAAGAKKCKECVTVLGANASRSFRLPLLVIRKSVKLRALKNLWLSIITSCVYKLKKGLDGCPAFSRLIFWRIRVAC